jgi:DNA-binding transcriptional LysR family regulator
MDLDPRRLLTLRAVALHHGVQGAAAALHLTPSAVSQQLHQLERAAGVTLFDRTGRTVGLTPAGESLLTAAHQIDDALRTAEAELGQRRDRIAGHLRVGSFQTAIVFLLAPAIGELHAQHPDLTIEIVETTDAEGIRMVRSGELDAATIEHAGPAARRLPSKVATVPLLDDPFVVIVPPTWRQRSFGALADVGWITSAGMTAADDALLAAFAEIGRTPRIAHRCSEYPPVVELVARGEGAAIVTSLALRLYGADRVRELPLPSVGSRTISLLHRTQRNEPSAAVRALVDALS